MVCTPVLFGTLQQDSLGFRQIQLRKRRDCATQALVTLAGTSVTVVGARGLVSIVARLLGARYFSEHAESCRLRHFTVIWLGPPPSPTQLKVVVVRRGGS